METIISALIAGGLALIGVIITNIANGKNIEKNLAINQAVTTEKLETTNVKLEDLKEEVRKHNNFAERIPVIEHDVAQLKEDVKDLKSR